jgi:hypothetical protein
MKANGESQKGTTMDNEIKKCQFCTLEATSSYRVYVITSPDEPQGSLHFDYFGEQIFACDKHNMEIQGFELNGDVMEGFELNRDRTPESDCVRHFKRCKSERLRRDSEG